MKTCVLLFSFITTVATALGQTTLPAGPALDGSVYDLASDWRTQEGNTVNLQDLKGKVRVVAMGYTSCQYACPRIIADLARIESELKKQAISSDEVMISFISIDPENDTPARMKKLESEYGFDSQRWLLLTGDEDGVLELAVALGMKYRKTSAMDFAHSNIISVIDPQGHIVYQTPEIGADLSKAMEAIRRHLPLAELGAK